LDRGTGHPQPEWDLLVIHWDEEQNLLFINSSGNSGYFRDMAEAVVGPADLISGPLVFRAFAGISRLTLQNVGLAEQLGRLIRYTMRAGSDVETGLTEAQKECTQVKYFRQWLREWIDGINWLLV
jgi:hypothetical protein